MKKISLIIPCYNAVSCIDACMQSVINQRIGMENLEVILVNDGSEDETYQKLCQWEQRYPESVMVINCEENGKQGRARNIGLQYATAPYVAFMDDDDVIPREMYESLYRYAVLGDYDLVISDYAEEKGKSKEDPLAKASTTGCLNLKEQESLSILSHEDRLSFLKRNIGVAIWNKLYNREMLLDHNIDFLEGYIYDDIYFSGLVKHYCRNVYITPEVFYCHIINENSASYAISNPMDRIGFLEVHMFLVEERRNRGLYAPFAEWYDKEFVIDYLTFVTNYGKTFGWGGTNGELYRIIRKNVLEMFPYYRRIPLVKRIMQGELNPIYKDILEELDQPDISIIIPCYNVEQYIDRCMESIVKQTIGIKNLEVILVNDASTDSTLDQLKKWESRYPEQILVITYEENMRQGGARNIGMQYARADYIGFVDADDWIEPDMYETLYQQMQKKPYDVVRGKFLREHFPGEKDPDKEELEEGNIWCGIYAKKTIFDHQVWFPEKVVNEDIYWDKVLKLYIRDSCLLDKLVYHYFINPNSTMTSRNAMYQLDRLNIEIAILEEYKKQGAFQRCHEELEFDFIKEFYLNTMYLIFTRFDFIPDIFGFMKQTIFAYFPDYRKNPRIETGCNLREKELLRLLEIPRDLSVDDLERIKGAYLKTMELG